MTTKEYLSQIKNYDRRINHKLSQIYQYRTLLTNISIAVKPDKIQATPEHDKMSKNIAKIVDLEREVNELVNKYTDLKQKIIEQIESLPNEEQIDVLAARFIQDLSFDEIPDEVGMSRRKVFYVYNKALEEFETRYGRRYKNLH